MTISTASTSHRQWTLIDIARYAGCICHTHKHVNCVNMFISYWELGLVNIKQLPMTLSASGNNCWHPTNEHPPRLCQDFKVWDQRICLSISIKALNLNNPTNPSVFSIYSMCRGKCLAPLTQPPSQRLICDCKQLLSCPNRHESD